MCRSPFPFMPSLSDSGRNRASRSELTPKSVIDFSQRGFHDITALHPMARACFPASETITLQAHPGRCSSSTWTEADRQPWAWSLCPACLVMSSRWRRLHCIKVPLGRARRPHIAAIRKTHKHRTEGPESRSCSLQLFCSPLSERCAPVLLYGLGSSPWKEGGKQPGQDLWPVSVFYRLPDGGPRGHRFIRTTIPRSLLAVGHPSSTESGPCGESGEGSEGCVCAGTDGRTCSFGLAFPGTLRTAVGLG